jgi:TIR domain
MAIPISTIEAAARRYQPRETLSEARRLGRRTAFLCHSHKDAPLLQGVVNLLAEAGWSVYLDWTDASMPDTPSRETALKIKEKIIELKYFLFLATANSMASRWCPWEIGYADGRKPVDDILIIPTSENSGVWHGNEYLGLYRRIDELDGTLKVLAPGARYIGTSLRDM